MKTRETKQKDLNALTESLAGSKSAMVVSFSKVTVSKDQEFRNSLREAGASYQIVKNTLARIAVKGTQFEDATEHFKGVTAIAWTQNDPVVLSKAISKFMKDNAETYSFKAGVVEGKLVNLTQLTTIANLPSKEELISQLLFVLNSSAQRLVTVLNAVPRDLAVIIKQIGEQEGRGTGTPAAEPEATAVEAAASADESASEASPAESIEAPPAHETAAETPADQPEPDTAMTTEAAAEEVAAAPDDQAEQAAEPADQAQSPDDKAEEVLHAPPAETEDKS